MISNEQPEGDTSAEKCKEFHLEEWKSLREEIACNTKEIRDTERNMVLASVAIWVWVLQDPKWEYRLALILPFAVSIFGWWRCDALAMSTFRIGGYLRQVEAIYGLSPRLGWEKYFRGQDGESKEQHELGTTGKVFVRAWCVCSALFSLAIYYLALKKQG